MLRLGAHNAASALRTRLSANSLRALCSATGKGNGSDVTAAAVAAGGNRAPRTSDRQGGLFSRLLGPGQGDGRNPFLAALGYYSRESVALGAGTSLYTQLRARAEDTSRAISSSRGGTQPFVLRFEMLSVHVYLSLHRLRREKGSPLEADCKTVMQCIFDVFWTDVRNRMLIEEEGMTLIPSGRWVKECEQMFFGMALAFDDAWDDRNALANAVRRNITSARPDVDGFVRYMWEEKKRLDKIPIEWVMQEKEIWNPRFSGPRMTKS